MPIPIGTQIGSHEITALLGKGGMGEVYRARDTKLKREVAIKILPEEFSRDADRVRRFQREAEVLASLNHPNIAGIYDLEEANEARFLVLELVEGETLADRLARGPLPLDEALGIATSICEALAAAHEKGVVHRDLKPGNIKLTPEGKVKVLDFGLAKLAAMESSSSAEAFSNSPTMLSAATGAGIILGTAAYMSPEQARGKVVDKRSDVWAFGCVLYEMLTGKRAFEGDDVTETLAAVLKGEPDWDSLSADTPSNILTLLKRCLSKDRQQRIVDITVAQFLLSEPPPAGVSQTTSRRAIALATVVLSIVIIASVSAIWVLLRPSSTLTRPVTRFTVATPPGITLLRGIGRPAIALSPDGTRLVYVALVDAGLAQLYSRTIDQLDSTPIRGTEGASGLPFFSPDGQWIGFFSSDSKLKKVPVGGGPALTICDALPGFGATWLLDDSIIFRPGSGVGLWRVAATGGAPQEFLKPDGPSEISIRWPEALPGGNAIVFAIQRSSDSSLDAIGTLRLDTRKRSVLVEGGGYPHYLPSGHIVFTRDGDVLAMPFDVRTLQVKGTPAVVIEHVLNAPSQAAVQFAASHEGTIAYVPGGEAQVGAALVWVDRRGVVQPLPAPKRIYQFPRLSPDGQQVAIRIQDTATDIWLYQIARRTLSRFTEKANDAETPVWTPDSVRIAYAVTGSNPARRIVWKMADGSGAEEVLAGSDHHLHLGGWSPKGDVLIALATDAGNMWALYMDDKRTLKPFLEPPYVVRAGTISPNGRWIAYSSNETNRFEVYVQAFPNPGRKYPISTDGGTEPIWARSGRELFYRNGDKLMAVAVDTKGDKLDAGPPTLLFEGHFVVSNVSGGDAWYDVSPDDKRFLMLKADESANNAASIVMVQNWTNELKRLAPEK
jgi:serine/threonine-protein kinase